MSQLDKEKLELWIKEAMQLKQELLNSPKVDVGLEQAYLHATFAVLEMLNKRKAA